MNAPSKPWERTTTIGLPDSEVNRPPLSTIPPDSAPINTPPNLPPRPTQQQQYFNSAFNGLPSYGRTYGNMYSPMGGSMYNGMYGNNGYGGYGSGGYGMNNLGQNYEASGFVRMAEENSQQAFQSIESIVQAVGSVAMMLESTYHAVYNSFRAVIGVADHFTRMKMHLAQIFSALAVIRSLKWFCRKLLNFLHLRKAGVSEEVWSAAADNTLGKTPSENSFRSSWPIMMFFGVVFGGPWLIWKLLSSLKETNGGGKWASGEEAHFVGQALHDFVSAHRGELNFNAGQLIHIAPKELQPRVRGWLLASIDGQETGLVPANYLKILGKRPGETRKGSEPLPLSSCNNTMTTGASGCCSEHTQPNEHATEQTVVDILPVSSRDDQLTHD